MSVTISSPASTGLMPTSMDQAVRLADMMAKGRLVPQHFHNQPGDCLMVIEQAMRWGMSPFAVAQATSVIQGKLMFEGKLVAAAVQSSGILDGRLRYNYSGEGEARTITVSGVLHGDTTPSVVTVRLRDAKTSNQLWTKQPDQQLAYHGARVWARRYAPEVMLGVYAPEEIETTAQPDFAGPTITIQPEPAEPPKRTAKQFLVELEEDLIGCRNWQDVESVLAHEDVRKAQTTFTNGLLEKLNSLIATARKQRPHPDEIDTEEAA